MKEKEEAAPDDVSIESGTGDQISRPAVGNPDYNSTTGSSRQQDISSFLPRGERNAISTEALLRLTGCTTARMLQERVAAERERGAVILSSGRGYFLPAEGNVGVQELQRFIQTLERRATGTLRTAESARAALIGSETQGSLEGGGGVKT